MNYDFHIHTALSTRANDDMTPNNIVNMAQLNGLHVIAVADYNSCANCRAVMSVGRRQGLVVIPGMELITAEGVHTFCLFPDPESAEACSREVYSGLPNVRCNPATHGRQLLYDDHDNILGEEDRLLYNACSIEFRNLPQLAMHFGGIAGFAHLDRHTGSALSVLGGIDPYMSFAMAEVTNKVPLSLYAKRFPFLSIYSNSNAYDLQSISEAGKENIIEANFSSAETFIRFLRELPI